MIALYLVGLRALVSGVPEPRRSQEMLFMLQALCDESESHNEPRVFVVGGYIATVERWEKITEAWQSVLDLHPRITEFKFTDAFPQTGMPRGQFHGMTIEERDNKVSMFRSILETYAQAEIGVGFKMEPYLTAFSELDKMSKNPYFFATSQLEAWVARNMEKIGLERGPIQFIYDDKKKEEPYILEAWFWTRKHANPDPADIYEKILTTAPQFRSSSGPNAVIALQAADLFVGWTRACNFSEMKGEQAMRLPGRTRDLPGIFLTYTGEMLKEAAERIGRRGVTP